ncbi:MAG: OmpA family protein [Pseudomonadota bacterium]
MSRLVSGLLMAVAGAATLVPSALAEQREVLIGTFQTGGSQAGATSADERWQDVSAEQLFSDAIARIERGQVWGGQRRLEVLVARFPRSAEAARARRVLGEIYRGRTRDDAVAAANPSVDGKKRVEPTPRANAPAGASTRGADIATGALGSDPPAEPPAAAPAWQPTLTRSARLENVLRAEAGDRVFFSEGSAEISSRSRTVLFAQARWLARNPYVHVIIEGHADESGSDGHNLAISKERAEMVRQRLVEAGVSGDRIAIVAKGRSERIAACDSPLCAAQNRRAVTLVLVESDSADRLPGRSSDIAPPGVRIPVAANVEQR